MTAFDTRRLTVRPWDAVLSDAGQKTQLERRLRRMLTPAVLVNLPPTFAPGDGPDAMGDWITARQNRAGVSLINCSHDLIGLLFLFRPDGTALTDLHVGYLFAEEAWGQGFATELLIGMVSMLRGQAPVTLKAGVARDNPASARVLQKAGFVPGDAAQDGEILHFQMALTTSAP